MRILIEHHLTLGRGEREYGINLVQIVSIFYTMILFFLLLLNLAKHKIVNFNWFHYHIQLFLVSFISEIWKPLKPTPFCFLQCNMVSDHFHLYWYAYNTRRQASQKKTIKSSNIYAPKI